METVKFLIRLICPRDGHGLWLSQICKVFWSDRAIFQAILTKMSFKLFACYIAKIFTFFICVVYASQGVLESVSPRSDIPSKRIPNERHEARMLRAARLKSDLTTRSITETLRHNHELHYLDGNAGVQYASYLMLSFFKICRVFAREASAVCSPIACDFKKTNPKPRGN